VGRKKSKKEKPAFDDYEYGYGYDYLLDDEEQKKPTDTADDADGLEEDEGAWWEDEPEEKVLAYIREACWEDSDEGREYKPDDETIDIPLENLLLDGVALELKLKPEEKEELEETEGRKLLQRELREEALRRFEESARTAQDFKNIHATWDKLDANRERRERYHELLRGDVPIDYQVDYLTATIIPHWRNDPMERQLQRGYFLDYFYDCPYEMYDLASKEYLRQIIKGLKEDHKEIFYFLFLRQFSPQYLALMRGQTDRNIRKVRDTVLRKIHKKMYKQLTQMQTHGYIPGAREARFLQEWHPDEESSPDIQEDLTE
jgi:hypothetical protein